MKFKYTSSTQKSLEKIFRECGYSIRYERGNFHAGHCILEKKKVVVINKFYDTESRITVLSEILSQIQLRPDKLSPESRELTEKILGISLPEVEKESVASEALAEEAVAEPEAVLEMDTAEPESAAS
jgi:hypothetical protein